LALPSIIEAYGGSRGALVGQLGSSLFGKSNFLVGSFGLPGGGNRQIDFQVEYSYWLILECKRPSALETEVIERTGGGLSVTER